MVARFKSMPTGPLNAVIQHLLADLRPDGDGRTDGELLARFLRSRDEDALAALVRRHAPMVWGVCSRLLRNHDDAEDAFQATFLVLVRKAAGVPGQAVANWLYGAARQTAVRVRATAAKRGRRETQVVDMPEPIGAEVRDADVLAVLDEELSRLPDHYRGVVVLCDLEGMTRREAARQLAIPEGSVASRLARARALLAKRLNQRGVTLSGGALAAILSQSVASAGVPALVVSNTIKVASLTAAGQAATGVISVKVAALTEGVVKAMFVSKLKAAFSVVLILGFMATGATILTYRTAAGQGDKRPTGTGPVATSPGPKEKGVAEPPKPREDGEILRGWWTVVKVRIGGPQAVDEGEVREVHIDHQGTTGGMISFEYPTRTDSMKYTVDPSKNPKEIGLIPTDALRVANREVYKGIYQLDGDELKINFTKNLAGGAERPTAFEGRNRGEWAYTLKRRNKSDDEGRYFGAVQERQVTSGIDKKTSFLDLDTGLHTEPNAAGADIVDSVALSDARARVGVKLVAVTAPDAKFESATPAEVAAALAKQEPKDRQNLGGKDRTYYFKTSEGNTGVLQIDPVMENKAVAQVRVRYKIICTEKKGKE